MFGINTASSRKLRVTRLPEKEENSKNNLLLTKSKWSPWSIIYFTQQNPETFASCHNHMSPKAEANNFTTQGQQKCEHNIREKIVCARSALTAILTVLWRLFITAFSCVKHVWINNYLMRLWITVTLGPHSALYKKSAPFSAITRNWV